MPQNDKALLLRLQEQNVEFVIIGGVCGVLYGVSLVTQDLDICVRLTSQNLQRIENAVRDLHPVHRLTANKLPLELTDELCSRLENLYLRTDLGVIDCLGEVTGIGEYDQVLKRSVIHKMSYGDFRILSIDALIDAKEKMGRDRDLAAVKQLRAIKEHNEQHQSNPESEI